MFTPDERRAVLFLAAVAALGGVLRAVRPSAAAPGEPVVPPPELAAGDLAAQAQAARRAEALARPLQPGERVDVDRADAAELDRLPRVGPQLAQRIVEEREANGPFGSLDGLARVPGVGPAMRRALERWTSFSGVARGAAASAPAPGPPAPVAAAAPACPEGPIALNRASPAELACLPGIGPALAARIVADRTARGPYREVQELERVPGLGPVRVARLAPRLTVP
jgi:competence protein ComEA